MLRLAEQHARVRTGKIKLFFRTGNTHIAKPALFLQIFIGIPAHLAGEYSFFQTDDEHIIKLQPLGRMHGHQNDNICAFIITVDITDERHFLQKARQAGFRTALIGIGLYTGNKLTDVFHARLAFFSLCLQHTAVSRDLQHLADEHIQRHRIVRFFQPAVNAPKAAKRRACPRQRRIIRRVLNNLQH